MAIYKALLNAKEEAPNLHFNLANKKILHVTHNYKIFTSEHFSSRKKA